MSTGIRVDSPAEEAVALRRDFHQHPELAFCETRTSARIADYLRRLGLEVRVGVAQTGVIGVLDTGRAGPVLLLRIDMDALPITERREVEYKSRSPGTMHACGHDAHMAMGLIAAKTLAAHSDKVRGTVKFVFQPAEEINAGARQMIEEGVLNDPDVNAAIGLHVWPDLPVGAIAWNPGRMMASNDQVRFVIYGRASHGALPHQGVDALLTAAHLAVALQSSVSRLVPPINGGLITLGTIHGGSLYNLVADQVDITGTVRCLSSELRGRMLQGARQTLEAITAVFGARGEMTLAGGTPGVTNHPAIARHVLKAAEQVVGADNVRRDYVTMASDDFGVFTTRVASCFFLLGVRGLDHADYAPLHNPYFDLDEGALEVGVKVLVATAQQVLNAT